jgi:predicted nucleotidyltransferase
MVKEALNSEKIIKKIKEKSKEIKRYNVKKIGLFGSYVKNKQHKKSDIDILVTFNKETFDNYMDLLFLLEKIFRRKIDLVIEKDLHPELDYVKKEVKYVRI